MHVQVCLCTCVKRGGLESLWFSVRDTKIYLITYLHALSVIICRADRICLCSSM